MRAWLLTAAFCLAACDGEDRQTPRPRPFGATATAELVAVSRPSLERLEEAARGQIAEQRIRLERLVETADRTSEADSRALAEAFGETGRRYLAYELSGPAAACFTNAVRLDPGTFRWHYYLGTVRQLEGDLETAAAGLERALELRPDDLPSLLRLGRLELDRHRPEQAQTRYRRALEVEPSSAAARYGLGRAAVLRHDTASAIRHFLAALEAQPDASAVHHSLGLAYRDDDDQERARSHLEKGGSRAPRFDDPLIDGLGQLIAGGRVHLSQGSRERRAGRLGRAVAHFRKAVALDPDNPRAHHNLGAVLGELGRHREGLDHLRRAVALGPDQRDPRFDLATALSRLGELEEAAMELSRVLEIDPRDRPARLRRALVFAAMGKNESGRDELAELVSQDPHDLESRFNLAAVELRLGHYGESAFHYASVAEHRPERLDAHLGAVHAWLLARRFHLAREHLEGAIDAGSHDSPLRHSLARLLATCPEAALRDGDRALELAREVFRSRRLLDYGETVGMALAEVGRFAEAARWQLGLIAEAEGARAPQPILRRLRERLASYENGEPIRSPWLADAGEGGAGV